MEIYFSKCEFPQVLAWMENPLPKITHKALKKTVLRHQLDDERFREDSYKVSLQIEFENSLCLTQMCKLERKEPSVKVFSKL